MINQEDLDKLSEGDELIIHFKEVKEANEVAGLMDKLNTNGPDKQNIVVDTPLTAETYLRLTK